MSNILILRNEALSMKSNWINVKADIWLWMLYRFDCWVTLERGLYHRYWNGHDQNILFPTHFIIMDNGYTNHISLSTVIYGPWKYLWTYKMMTFQITISTVQTSKIGLWLCICIFQMNQRPTPIRILWLCEPVRLILTELVRQTDKTGIEHKCHFCLVPSQSV